MESASPGGVEEDGAEVCGALCHPEGRQANSGEGAATLPRTMRVHSTFTRPVQALAHSHHGDLTFLPPGLQMLT